MNQGSSDGSTSGPEASGEVFSEGGQGEPLEIVVRGVPGVRGRPQGSPLDFCDAGQHGDVLYGVSVARGPTVLLAVGGAKWITHPFIRIADVDAVLEAGGTIRQEPADSDPRHQDIDGLTGEQLQSLFGEPIDNPNHIPG